MWHLAGRGAPPCVGKISVRIELTHHELQILGKDGSLPTPPQPSPHTHSRPRPPGQGLSSSLHGWGGGAEDSLESPETRGP